MLKKRFWLTFITVVLITYYLPTITYADSCDFSYEFPIESSNDIGVEEDEDDEDPYNKGRRSWQMCQMCTIDSHNGVKIPGVDKNDIITYEVWESADVCVGIFYSESEFLTLLPSMSGNMRIVFRLSTGCIYGDVNL